MSSADDGGADLASTEPTGSPAGGVSADPGPAEPAAAGVAGQRVADAEPVDDREPTDDGPVTVESLLDDLVEVTAERDAHLADLQRLGADFANFRKRVDQRHATEVAQAASGLVDKLLPVLDACEAAVSHGAADVDPILTTLRDVLVRQGLESINEPGEAFDPTRHEAVQSEDGEGGAEGDLVVAEVFRAGYGWNGRVLRPAMVKVRG